MEANKVLLQKKYSRIIGQLAKEANISELEAMKLFYESNTYQLISEGVSDMHCYSDLYLVDEIMLEYRLKEDIGYY
ncbi:DUF3791 domain-containing protein [Anaeromicropila herbilytica]|uniref:DUF3791 domain-containing protein n=1 Tax=Anaeromicropila herbilytica TaxID=2785025 RepID=A0A7R7IDL2_9FIRM|nr:DUF3791 domain-containing protein [Anaeromicropila herbilytica]BCN31833.1 hypothetical protein bsdtb5_31280 [Anaeromicropila herbilytica]